MVDEATATYEKVFWTVSVVSGTVTVVIPDDVNVIPDLTTVCVVMMYSVDAYADIEYP